MLRSSWTWVPFSQSKGLDEETFVQLFGEPALKWCQLDGNIYGTPQDSGALALFYRQDIFDQYGLEVPKTWDEFATQAGKLHSQAPEIHFISIPADFWWIAPVWQAGTTLFDYKDGTWYIHFTNPTAQVFLGERRRRHHDLDMWWTADGHNAIKRGQSSFDNDRCMVLGGEFTPGDPLTGCRCRRSDRQPAQRRHGRIGLHVTVTPPGGCSDIRDH